MKGIFTSWRARGYFSPNSKSMALTATATKKTRKEICKCLGMTDPVMVVKSPEKPNLVHSVCEKHGVIEEAFIPIVEELQWKRTKINVFCCTYDDTSTIYLFFGAC